MHSLNLGKKDIAAVEVVSLEECMWKFCKINWSIDVESDESFGMMAQKNADEPIFINKFIKLNQTRSDSRKSEM